MSINFNILNYLIIGAGPIGLYAGNKLKSRNKSFLIVEKRKTIGGQPIIIYPSKEIDNIPHIKKITSTDLIAL
jgi:cation diffusion facilitator CzcD-associated flavoprotein CzcO